jgi:SAM-dependent methyltransferase
VTRDEAQLYALVHDGSPGDVGFYVRLCEEGERVLELGCGAGRVSRALAEAGFDVVGLESDPGMLEEARAHPHPGLEIVEGDMRAFELSGRFDRILIPFTGLYCLPSAEALDACLRGAAAHLAPDGLLAFDAYCADGFHAESRPEDYPDDHLEHVTDVTHEGERLAVYEKSTWDRDAQRVLATYVYRRADGSTRAELEIAHRYVLTEQLFAALERAGLSLLGLYGGFDGEVFGPDADALIVVAELADAARGP